MTMLQAVVYRSEDPIENFKLRVTLRTIAGGYMGMKEEAADPEPKAEPEPEPEDEAEPEPEEEAEPEPEDEAEPEPEPEEDESILPVGEAGQDKDEDEAGVYTATFGWQEKQFSQKEVAAVRDAEAAAEAEGTKMPLKMVQSKLRIDKLNAELTDAAAGGGAMGGAKPPLYAGGVLSTYVEGDEWEESEWESVITNGKGAVTGAAARLQALDSSKKVVKMSKLEKHLYTSTPFSRMRVVATLPTEDGKLSVRPLCILKSYKLPNATVLEMRPGFNSLEVPVYRFIHEGSVYELMIEQASDLPDEDEQKADRTRRAKERAEQRRLLHNRAATCKDDIFRPLPTDPTDKTKSWLVLLQLTCAREFDASSLYVEFQWSLPPRWKSNVPETQLRGMTQIAGRVYERSDWLGRHPIFHLGLGQEFEMIESAASSGAGAAAAPPPPPPRGASPVDRPQLFLRVCSLDSWERFRLLGYCCVALPELPGRRQVSHQSQNSARIHTPAGCWASCRRTVVALLGLLRLS
jgi:hypothetical protein|eukprot:COSAG01_NODE_10056_length_2260_cov_780.577973_1_plen_519_part_00